MIDMENLMNRPYTTNQTIKVKWFWQMKRNIGKLKLIKTKVTTVSEYKVLSPIGTNPEQLYVYQVQRK